MSELSWFGVRLVFETLISSPEPIDLPFEERVVLVRAVSEDDAQSKAVKHAASEEHSYQNQYGDTLTVVFREILDVCELLGESVGEFSEVYYNSMSQTELDHVRASIVALL